MLEPQLPKLTEEHDLGSFVCGAAEIDDWLHKRAWKGQQLGNAIVYVVAKENRVLGFYALATGGVELLTAPGAVKRNAPETIPILLLARLGVDRTAQRRGIGAALLQDAVLRAAQVARSVGFRALLIHCRDDEARAFYLRQIPSFLPSPTDPLHLFLPTAALSRY